MRPCTTHRERILRKLWGISLTLITLFSCAVYISFTLSGCAVHAVDSKSGQGIITVTGKIRLVGNEPFTHLIITSDDGRDYLIQGDLEKELRAYQHQKVMVKGEKLLPTSEFFYRIEVKEYKHIYRTHY